MGARQHWSNRFMFILAAAGSAIGLGNLWKFPYITGINGGGAFVLLYLLCIAIVGLPILIAEMYIGQQSQVNAVSAFEKMHQPRSMWRVAGFAGLLSAVLILSFYAVVGGWVFDFLYRSVLFEFQSMSEAGVESTLSTLFSSPLRQVIWFTLFMLLTAGITAGGIKNGLEKWNRILMPSLFVILVALFVYALFLPGFAEAFTFLFRPDFSKLNASSILEAMGHSFFTLSLGMGCILTYGSFLDKKESLPRIALTIAGLDTVIALMAGVVIFSIVFSYGLEASSGPGLMFATLPVLFQKIPMGNYVSILFFLLVSFAALTSAVSMLEVVVAYLEEKRKWLHKKAVVVSASMIYLLGFLSLFSTNIMSDFKIFGKTFFDLFDLLTSSYLLPFGGLIISLFLGWKLSYEAAEKILGKGHGYLAKGLVFTTRFLAPAGVLAVLVNKIVETLSNA